MASSTATLVSAEPPTLHELVDISSGDFFGSSIGDFDFPILSVEDYLTATNDEDANTTTETSSSRKAAQPVPLGTSITTTHTKDLNEALQHPSMRQRLRTEFAYREARTETGAVGFQVVLKLVDTRNDQIEKEISPEATFPSKKHAKEAAAGLGVEYIGGLPRSTAKASGSGGSVAGGVDYASPVDNENNWVGKVTEYCQLRSVMPQFDFFQAPSSKGKGPMQATSCVLTLPATLSLPDIESKRFGDGERWYRSKMDAKQAASKEAMDWIVSVAPESVKKGAQKSSVPDVKRSDGLIRLSPDMSCVQAVHTICPYLNLGLPEWDFKQDPTAPGIYDVTAIIRRRNGPKDVKIGPLKNEFGKKRAKEKMAEGILRWLFKEAEKEGVRIVKDS